MVQRPGSSERTRVLCRKDQCRGPRPRPVLSEDEDGRKHLCITNLLSGGDRIPRHAPGAGIRRLDPDLECAGPVTGPFLVTTPVTTTGQSGPLPGWTRQQRLQALSKANEIRAAQAQLKSELARGDTQIRGILTQPPDYAANLQVSKLLRAVPGYGPARVARILTRTRIGESTRLARLTDRQRTELINHFHC